MKPFRYPGVRPFTISQANIFFGREDALEKLHRMVRLEDLTVLYSKSGMGKSSLLNAGLIPMIEEEGKYRPFTIRIGPYRQGEGTDPLETTMDLVNAKAADPQPGTFPDQMFPDEKSLWYSVKRAQIYQPDDKPFLLIFDQFEELFTHPSADITAFKKALSEVLNDQTPARIAEKVEARMMAGESPDADSLEALYSPTIIKIVFAIRADSLHLLSGLADYLPEVKKNWFLLDALNREEAEEAILNPAYAQGDFASPNFDYSDEALVKIFDYLTQENTKKVESFQLQILCQAIERKVMANQIEIVEPDHLGNIQDVYENYYEDQIALLPTREDREKARKFIEEGLILEEEQRRLTLYEGQIERQYDVSPELLQKLQMTHLIRRESSEKGGFTYELSHDTLVAPVLKSKARRMARLREEQLIQEKREKEIELLKIRKRRRVGMLLTAISFITAIGALWGFLWVKNLQREYERTNQQLFAIKKAFNDNPDLLAFIDKKAEESFGVGNFEEAKFYYNLLSLMDLERGKGRLRPDILNKEEDPSLSYYAVMDSLSGMAKRGLTKFYHADLKSSSRLFRDVLKFIQKNKVKVRHDFIVTKLDQIKKIKESFRDEMAYSTGSLKLAKLGLFSISDTINNLSDIDSLFLQGNNLEKIYFSPDCAPPASLKYLNLRENELVRFRIDSTLVYEDFVELNLSDNRMEEFSVTAQNFPKLEKLLLPGNKFTHFPEALYSFTNLKQLDLSRNQIKYLESDLANLNELEELDLSGNLIKSLGDEIGQLKNLKVLRITGTGLKNLPESLGNLTQLRELYLSENEISKIPQSFEKLEKLEVLEITDNHLEEIPAFLLENDHLITLKATRNRLKTLPGGNSPKSKLKTLDVAENDLEEIPQELVQQKSLRSLNASGNSNLQLKDGQNISDSVRITLPEQIRQTIDTANWYEQRKEQIIFTPKRPK